MTPPWTESGWKDYCAVRDDYSCGLWDYAIGRPASEHPDYRKAKKIAQRDGWNPWWIRSWQDVRAVMDGGCYFCDKAATRIIEFCTKFVRYPLEDGGGSVRLLDWQIYDFLAPLFGWMREEGIRRFRRGCLWVPKKNGKSFLCSLIALFMLVLPSEAAPEVYVAAGDREQASIVYGESSALAASSPQIDKRVRRIDSRKRINRPDGRGFYRVLSSDAKLAEGIKWSCMILDELHVQKSTMWQTVKGGGVSRQQPLMVAISTAGVYDETSIGWEQWQYSDRVRRGDVDNWAYFAVQYCANENDDWTDPETWRKANPSYGEVLREDALRELYDEARDNPSEQPNFKRYHLNQWVQSLSIWIARDKWDACADETLTEESLHGRMCYGAMDMSSTDDMTALALWFPGKEDEPESLLEWFWLPGDNINEMAEKNNAPYAAWHDQGLLRLTPGNFIDVNALEDDVCEILCNFDVVQLAYDRYQSEALSQTVEKRLGIEPVLFPQTTRAFNEPMKQYTEAVVHRKLRHRGHPIMRWMLGNCQVVYDSGGLMKLSKTDGGGVNKKGVRRLKIDGQIAAVMACGTAKHADVSRPGILVL